MPVRTSILQHLLWFGQAPRGLRADVVVKTGQYKALERATEPAWHRIVERLHPDRVILFGSHARGMAGQDSDVDLLVVMPVTGSKRERRLEVRLALHEQAVDDDLCWPT